MIECTLFVGHGSRDQDGNEEFLAFVESIRELTPNHHVESCFLELASPTIPDGIDACRALGATRIVIVPVILLAASHVKLEIPQFIDEARAKYPHIEFVYGRNIGLHEEIVELLSTRFQEQAALLESTPENTAIVLMGRGSSDADANGDVYKIARQLWERTGVSTVEVCFTGITFPRFQDGIRRAIALGADHIIVVPYFLFTGILMKRMNREMEELQKTHPDVRISMAPYFGNHPLLREIVRDRRIEAALGQAYMNCDLCKYRREAMHEHHHHHEHGDHEHHDHHLGHEDQDDSLVSAKER